MHTEKREDPLTDMGYEIRDANVKLIFKAVIWFITFDALCYAAVGLWFYLAKPQISSSLNPRHAVPQMTVQGNISVRTDIQEFRKAETAALGHVGKNKDGSYSIPIDTAIEKIAERGLPTTVTQTPAVTQGNTIKQNAVGEAPIAGGIQPSDLKPPTSSVPAGFGQKPSKTPPPPLPGKKPGGKP